MLSSPTSWRAIFVASLLVVATFANSAGASGSVTTLGTITVSDVGATTATLSGSVDPGGVETTAWFAYSVTATLPFGSSTAPQDIGAGTALVPFSANLTGLTEDTTYYVQLVAENSSTTTSGPLAMFTTGGPTTATIAPMTMKDSRSGAGLSAITCPEVSTCWATGNVISKKTSFGIIDRLSNGTWLSDANSKLSLSGIDCPSPTSCWAVGSTLVLDYMVPAALHYNGRSWTPVGVPAPAGTRTDYLTAVTCPSTTSCWAVGGIDGASSLGRALVEHYDGRSWSVVASPGPSNDSLLNAISCTSATSCWAVGIANDFGRSPAVGSLIERWNGRSWSRANAPDVRNGLYGVSCRWTSACFAIGSKLLQFSGGSWRVAPLVDISVSAIDCSSTASCWVITSFGGETQHWNGASWTNAVGPSVPTGQARSLDAITCITGGPCIAVGNQGPKGTTVFTAPNATRVFAEQTSVGQA